MAFVFFLIGLIAIFGLILSIAGGDSGEGGLTGLGCLVTLLAVGGMIALVHFVNIGDGLTPAIIILVILAVVILGMILSAL